MDALQIQISELNQKVDQLHKLIERISAQVNALTAENGNRPEKSAYSSLSVISPMMSHSSSIYGERANSFTHKDILVDDGSEQTHMNSTKEQDLSPDIQIRRLTAQLTAAYNRIASLEEQLLACRIKS
ncbi:MAG: hypothetical protein QNJ34_13145 [Xenococcaceae cyanobacterium MO_188.B29]|nr:hypothetical protein [Xenococcaceae cyanobacterium MO_188.B29]